MSILPSRNLGSTSSSSSNLHSPNPNSQHGTFNEHQLFQFSDSFSDQRRDGQSLPISDPVATSDDHSGSVAPQDSGGSSKKMNETRAKNNLVHHKNGSKFQHQAAGRAGVVPTHQTGAPSETILSPVRQQTSGSTHSSGRKGQMVNCNHLLNFHYDAISRPQPRAPPPRRQLKRKPYNKDLFVQANYKFVLLDSGRYAPGKIDPDESLHWEDIICVKYSSPLPVHCPICLEDPLCPQITSCGHIFCFPCILRYFSMGEDDFKVECFKRCPLCFVMISPKDLYTIYIENVKQYIVGDTIEFILLTRQRDSFSLSLKNKQGMNGVENVHDSFSKFTFTSDVDLSVRKAMTELDSWLARAESGLVDDIANLPYVSASMEQLEQRKKNWNIHRAVNGTSQNVDCHVRSPLTASVMENNGAVDFTWGTLCANVSEKPTLLESSSEDTEDGKPSISQDGDVVKSYENQDGSLSSSYDDSKSTLMQANTARDRNENSDSYNFYQAIDGQHLILHPLNMKCLLHHYGIYSRLPHRISGKIVQLETVSQSEAMRRRYRHLSHFSLTTTFQLCEIDLSESLPPDALSPFLDEIKKREKQRKRLAKKEQEEKLKAEVAATTEYMTMPFNLAPPHDISPSFSMDDFEALGSPPVVSASPPTVGERPLFSNVTRLGFAAAHDSPALKSEEAHNFPKTDAASNSSSLSGTESFANVISRAKPVESKVTEMGKKGKKASRVLLSTAGGRRY